MESQPTWYVARDGRRIGPYALESLQIALQKGLLLDTDLAWRPGFDDWTPLRDIEEFHFPPEPPADRDLAAPSVVHAAPALEPAAETETAPERRGRFGYVGRHWRGDFSLGFSYWVNGPVVTIAITIVVLLVAARAEANLGSAVWLIGLSAMILTLPFVTVWQFVGIWRSASRHTGRGGRRGWAIAAKIAVVLGALRSIVDLGNVFPVVTEFITMAMGDRYGPPSFRLVRNGTELEFKGGIAAGLHLEFERFLQASPNLKVVHLTSQGGRIAEAELIAKEVKRRNLATYVSSFCASACTEIFIAGQRRWAASSAKIGFHSPSFPGLGEIEMRRIRADAVAYLVNQGVDRAFAEKAISTRPTSMWYPTIKEMIDAKVVTGIAERDQFAASALTMLASTESARSTLEKIPVFAAIRDVYPDEYVTLVKQATDGYAAGESEQEILGKGKRIVSKLVSRSLAVAPTDIVVRHGRLTLAYLRKLKEADAESCVAHTDSEKGAKSRINVAQRFPDLVKEELALNATIVKTAVGSKIAKPTAQEIAADMSRVMARLRLTYGNKVSLINASRVPPEDFATYCRMNIDFYEYVLGMAPERGSRILRYIYAAT
ncbi:MAG TPA: GYF domain-containing protein [Xanthobacteraceae bacterium]|nr:GYF domain-containing protein [Xanthobacteraceae bacterium]